MIFDDQGRSDIVRIVRAHPGRLELRAVGPGAPLPFQVGALIVPLEIHAYYWDADTATLRMQDGWRSDLPVVDNVVGFTTRYFGRAGPSRRTFVERPSAPCLMERPLHTSARGDAYLAERELHPSMLSDGPWCGGRLPYDTDLASVTRVRIELRLQVRGGRFRGRSPELFARPGHGRASHLLVPDAFATIEVSPRGVLLP